MWDCSPHFLCLSTRLSYVLETRECCPKIDQRHERRRQIAIWNFLLFGALFPDFFFRKEKHELHKLCVFLVSLVFFFLNAIFNLIFIGRLVHFRPRVAQTGDAHGAQQPTQHTHTPDSHTPIVSLQKRSRMPQRVRE